jgi:hypothetical protein
MDNVRLRALVTSIEMKLRHLTRNAAVQGGPPSPALLGLLESWRELSHLMRFGENPTLAECPACHHAVMSTATACGHCWTRLAPA